MLKSRVELENYLESRCEKLLVNKEKQRVIEDALWERHRILPDFTNDLLTKRASLSDQSEYILFCLLEGIILLDSKKDLKEFFLPTEIEVYSKVVGASMNEIKMPIVINAIQIASDQWIGGVDVDFFVKLRNAQKINYNENTQRTLRRIIRGETEYYKIAVNKRAVSEIQRRFTERSFIPNTITLNIPMNENSEFYYDTEKNQLVINKLDAFDISDGYHRFLAMCRAKDEDKEFNYPMEVRITWFEEHKAKQFTFQEDQKTSMKKIDSKALDMTASANIVVERLNQDPLCLFKGLITRQGSVISSADLGQLIGYFYFKNSGKVSNIEVMKTTEEIKKYLNAWAGHNPYLLETYIPFSHLCGMMYVFIKTDYSTDKKCRIIEKLINDKYIYLSIENYLDNN